MSALRKLPIYNYKNLKSYFPNLTSIEEFITSESYLGNIILSIKYTLDFSNNDLRNGILFIINKIQNSIIKMDEVYSGTKTFESLRVCEIFKDKIMNITNPENDSVGISQASVLNDEYKLDLSDKDWYVYNDNYGTTEEKKFVKYFNDYIELFEKKYSNVYLIRNERILKIYSFENGERFEPDYLLILIDKNKIESKQFQIFIEPKGNQLLQEDKWKEDLLLSLKQNAIPITKFVDDNEYFIWGLPFFNKDNKMIEFKESLENLL